MSSKTKPNYAGMCSLCNRTFSRRGISRHVATCKARQSGKVDAMLLLVDFAWAYDFYLLLEISPTVKLLQLDHFLRRIWLECCGHLSAFDIKGVRYDSHPDPNGGFMGIESRSMDVAVGNILGQGDTFRYVYDFGSTTELIGKVVKIVKVKLAKPEIQVVGRNELPEMLCDQCDKPAVWVHSWQDALYCDKHVENREEVLPVVNSPRMGVCGYTGEDGF